MAQRQQLVEAEQQLQAGTATRVVLFQQPLPQRFQRALSSCLARRDSRLSHLELPRCAFSTSFFDLAEAFAPHSGAASTLRYLNLYDVHSDSTTALAQSLAAVLKAPTCALFYLNLSADPFTSHAVVDDTGALALAGALSANRSLAVLKLNDNPLTDRSGQAFAETLHAGLNATLEVLDLRGTAVRRNILEACSKACARNKARREMAQQQQQQQQLPRPQMPQQQPRLTAPQSGPAPPQQPFAQYNYRPQVQQAQQPLSAPQQPLAPTQPPQTSSQPPSRQPSAGLAAQQPPSPASATPDNPFGLAALSQALPAQQPAATSAPPAAAAQTTAADDPFRLAAAQPALQPAPQSESVPQPAPQPEAQPAPQPEVQQPEPVSQPTEQPVAPSDMQPAAQAVDTSQIVTEETPPQPQQPEQQPAQAKPQHASEEEVQPEAQPARVNPLSNGQSNSQPPPTSPTSLSVAFANWRSRAFPASFNGESQADDILGAALNIDETAGEDTVAAEPPSAAQAQLQRENPFSATELSRAATTGAAEPFSATTVSATNADSPFATVGQAFPAPAQAAPFPSSAAPTADSFSALMSTTQPSLPLAAPASTATADNPFGLPPQAPGSTAPPQPAATTTTTTTTAPDADNPFATAFPTQNASSAAAIPPAAAPLTESQPSPAVTPRTMAAKPAAEPFTPSKGDWDFGDNGNTLGANRSGAAQPVDQQYLVSLGVPLAPVGAHAWTPDEWAQTCELCHAPFTLQRRRHHCRRCGRCICAKCSPKEAFRPLAPNQAPERHCLACVQ